MQTLKRNIVPIFLLVVQCFVLYKLWPHVTYVLQKKICKKNIVYKQEKKRDPTVLLAAIFRVKKKEKLKNLVAQKITKKTC